MERSVFPIYNDAAKWESFDWTKIPDPRPQVRAMITHYQPCNRTDGLAPADHPLAVLSRLNNIDKHRALLVLTTRITASHSLSVRGDVHIHSFEFNYNLSSTELDTDIARGKVTLGHGAGVQMDSQATTEIAFKQLGADEPEPVIPTLQGLLNRDRQIAAIQTVLSAGTGGPPNASGQWSPPWANETEANDCRST